MFASAETLACYATLFVKFPSTLLLKHSKALIFENANFCGAFIIERFSMECHKTKTKTKAITANVNNTMNR